MAKKNRIYVAKEKASQFCLNLDFEHLLDSTHSHQTDIYVFGGRGSKRGRPGILRPTSHSQGLFLDLSNLSLQNVSTEWGWGWSGVGGSGKRVRNKPSNRRPLFIRRLFKELKVEGVRFIFLST